MHLTSVTLEVTDFTWVSPDLLNASKKTGALCSLMSFILKDIKLAKINL